MLDGLLLGDHWLSNHFAFRSLCCNLYMLIIKFAEVLLSVLASFSSTSEELDSRFRKVINVHSFSQVSKKPLMYNID
jgi:hypothetical protein